MSPEKAKVFVVEDNLRWQDSIRLELENGGHEVVLTATLKKDAIEKAKGLEELGVQITTLDGNLNKFDLSGKDAQEILKVLREHAPSVKVIGFSGGGIKGVDVDLGKFRLVDLAQTISEL